MLLGKDIIRNKVQEYRLLNSDDLVNFLFYRIPKTRINSNLDRDDFINALECMFSHIQEMSDPVITNNDVTYYLTPANKTQSNNVSLYENIYERKFIGTLIHYFRSVASSL